MKMSEILQRQIQDIDTDTEEWEGWIDPEEKQAYEALRQLRIKAVEGFLPAKLTEVLLAVSPKTRELTEWGLDDTYSRVLVSEIPRIVERALKLAPVWTTREPSKPAEIYLREGTRAFLLGLFQATVALCRSAFEQGLKDRLRSQLAVLAEADELSVLLKTAEMLWPRILEPDLIQLGHEVRNAGNNVLHGTPCNEQAAFDCLIKVRKILGGLYD